MQRQHLAGRRVVVIDDDADQAASLAQALRQAGLQATHEHLAEKALVDLMLAPPDAVIVDVTMPRLSGPDLVATLRVRNRSLPAVLVSGDGEPPPPRQPAMASRTAYVSKPVEVQRLLDALSQVIRTLG